MLRFLLPFLILTQAAPLFAQGPPSRSDSLVAAAWASWSTDNQQLVEKQFKDAILADPSNARAYLGLSYLYELQEKQDSASGTFRSGLACLKDPYPYIFAAWLTPKIRPDAETKGGPSLELLKRVAEDAAAPSSVRASACENLARFYADHADPETARRYQQGIHPILDWTLIGPFENISASGFDKPFPPETAYDTGATYAGKEGVPAKWFAVHAARRDGWIDFKRYFASTQAVFYGHTYVYSPAERPVEIRIGTSGSLKAFLNDDLLLAYFDENNNDLDTYIIRTRLQAGWNSLLIKCGYSEIHQCNFLVRITDEQGEQIPDLAISPDVHPSPQHPGVRPMVVDNFAESFFRNQILQHPQHFENYMLLADCYLRNDKAIEAELVLRDAVALSPSCTLFHNRLLEAYVRGEKTDKISETLERLSSLDQHIPSVIEYRISRALENEEFEEAEGLVKEYERLLPGSQKVYGQYLNLYAKKKQPDRIMEICRTAYDAYPDSWPLTYLTAVIAVETTQSFPSAIAIIHSYLRRGHSDANALYSLGEYQLRSSDLEGWENTYRQLMDLDPASTGYIYQMSKTYLARRDLAAAETSIRNALTLCPGCSTYWEMLGDIYRNGKQTDRAIDAYKSALAYYPADYSVRATLRELEGKPPIQSLIPQVNTDSLIRCAPEASLYPGKPAVILMSDARRIVHEGGSTESAYDLLIKIFNSEGIDNEKERTIAYNSHAQKLIVEKAVVIKKDRTQVKADVDQNSIVFKSLEPGDILYLKWRLQDFFSGMLANHFWDTQYFNGRYPIRVKRYSLLVPDGVTFQHKGQGMPDSPTVARTSEGTLYQWSSFNEPAIESETGMPDLDDVGKILRVSNIGTWSYFVDWYTTLAREKTRSSYEVREQVKSLMEGKGVMTEEEKIRTIHDFITEHIRYSSVPFRQSALIPQKARDVLVARLGDCKDVATLCISMLREVELSAYHVLVNTRDEGVNLDIVPMLAFNHCIVGVETSRGTRYLDLTAGNYPWASLPLEDAGCFALPIKPGVTAPFHLPKDGLLPGNLTHRTTLVVRNDNSLRLNRTVTSTGIIGARTRGAYRNQAPEDQEKTLVESLTDAFPGVKITSLAFANLDTLEDAVNMNYTGDVPNFASVTGKFKVLKRIWALVLEPDGAISTAKRNYPYDLWAALDTAFETVSVQLPAGYRPVKLPRAVDYSCSIGDYAVRYATSGNLLTATRRFVYKRSMVQPEEFTAYKEFYNKALQEDQRQIILEKR